MTGVNHSVTSRLSVITAGDLDQIGASEASRKGIVKNWLIVQNIAKSHLRKRISNHQMRVITSTAVLFNIRQTALSLNSKQMQN